MFIIVDVTNSCDASYFSEIPLLYCVKYSLMNRKLLTRTAFIWNRNLLKTLSNVFNVALDELKCNNTENMYLKKSYHGSQAFE